MEIGDGLDERVVGMVIGDGGGLEGDAGAYGQLAMRMAFVAAAMVIHSGVRYGDCGPWSKKVIVRLVRMTVISPSGECSVFRVSTISELDAPAACGSVS